MTEACYWCKYIQADRTTRPLSPGAFCRKLQKRVNLEDEGCEDFLLYDNLRSMMEEVEGG